MIGRRCTIHYGRRSLAIGAKHQGARGRVTTVASPGRCAPRNVAVRLDDGAFVVVPRWNVILLPDVYCDECQTKAARRIRCVHCWLLVCPSCWRAKHQCEPSHRPENCRDKWKLAKPPSFKNDMRKRVLTRVFQVERLGGSVIHG